jgi:hypothetical protein
MCRCWLRWKSKYDFILHNPLNDLRDQVDFLGGEGVVTPKVSRNKIFIKTTSNSGGTLNYFIG